MSIVTGTGDEGMTGLFGGKRVSKDSKRIEAYGTVDELNAVIGLVLTEKDLQSDTRTQLEAIQHLLFRVGGDLATPLEKRAKEERMNGAHVQKVEEWIHELEATLPEQKTFILPGGSRSSALLHLARTVCRRAERCVVGLMKEEKINPSVRIFLNRLGDYFFLAARNENVKDGIEETGVKY